ncbi:hypothetical protein AAG570_012297 [Ranatra chinensis]|uniref:Cytosol aminopeptidase domain-containing protein n=1 Tax=Ranatra chinensis TaxID=642074 RepID=A0ABD0YIF6_9HEMI
MDELKEAIRRAAASGCQALQDLYIRTIFVDSFGHAESSAEGAGMGVWLYQELKRQELQKSVPRLELFEDCDFTGWQIGLQKAAAQNLARQLSETPGNLLTPIAFAQSAIEFLGKAGVTLEIRSKDWAKLMGFNAFLAAAKGSCEPPVFLEAVYYGCEADVAPIVLIGKGVTFDSGGLVRKDYQEMLHMRGDMAGAACVVATCRASLPGPCAMKPGDIVRAKNGKSILVESADFDGRMGLADAFCYATNYNPKVVVSVGTMREEMRQTLGIEAAGVFANNDVLYEQMRIASIHTGDRVWRLPLWQHYTEMAAFLREFLPPSDWLHMDIYAVNMTEGDTASYLRKGMTGRPTRTLIEFLAQFACKSDAQDSSPPPAS